MNKNDFGKELVTHHMSNVTQLVSSHENFSVIETDLNSLAMD